MSLCLSWLSDLARCEIDSVTATLTAAVAHDECSRVVRRMSSGGYCTRTHKTQTTRTHARMWSECGTRNELTVN